MLRELYEQLWEQNNGLDYVSLRDKAFASLAPGDYGDALYEALLADCYQYTITKRREKPKPEPVPSPARKPATGQRNSARSAKARALRAKWPILRSTYPTGDGARKALEYMTAAECRYAASVNARLAEGNLRSQAWLESIAAEIDSAGVKSAGALPSGILDRLQRERQE
jgi:hypothetical protein